MQITTIEPLWIALWIALPLLLLFGTGYALCVWWLQQRGYAEGFTSLLVVAGVLITLFPLVFVVGPWAVVAVLIAFAASGTPMIAGSAIEYVLKRQSERRAVSEVIKQRTANGTHATQAPAETRSRGD